MGQYQYGYYYQSNAITLPHYTSTTVFKVWQKNETKACGNKCCNSNPLPVTDSFQYFI